MKNSEILDESNSANWRHIPTHCNPADLLSRGIDPSAIKSCDLWWYGPSFLRQDTIDLPHTPTDLVNLPEIKSNICYAANDAHHNSNFNIINFERFLNFMRLQRSICNVLRFIKLLLLILPLKNYKIL